jgi:type I restriction enzyme M protein
VLSDVVRFFLDTGIVSSLLHTIEGSGWKGPLMPVLSSHMLFFGQASLYTTIEMASDKNLAKKADSILFVKVENDGFDLGAQRRPIDKNDLTQALAILQPYKQAVQNGEDPRLILSSSEVSKMAVIAEKSKIAKNGDYNLSGERYRENHVKLHQKWPMVELGEVFEKINQNVDPQQMNGVVRYVGLENIVSDIGQLVGTTSIDALDIKSLKSQFMIGGILYGKLRPNLNKVWLANFDGICSTDILVLRPNRAKVINRLYQFLLRSNEFNQEVLKGLKGAQLPRVSYEYISRLEIPLPSLQVQQEIVTELDSYQKIIDGARQIVDTWKPVINIDTNWDAIEIHPLLWRPETFGLTHQLLISN